MANEINRAKSALPEQGVGPARCRSALGQFLPVAGAPLDTQAPDASLIAGIDLGTSQPGKMVQRNAAWACSQAHSLGGGSTPINAPVLLGPIEQMARVCRS